MIRLQRLGVWVICKVCPTRICKGFFLDISLKAKEQGQENKIKNKNAQSELIAPKKIQECSDFRVLLLIATKLWKKVFIEHHEVVEPIWQELNCFQYDRWKRKLAKGPNI